MTGPKIAPYGSWKSPLSSELIASGSVGLSQPKISGDDLYFVELRPAEGGRNVIVRRDANGAAHDLNPAPFNARTRVHEYGGGDYVVNNGTVYFSNFTDQRLYRESGDQLPQALTAEGEMRYADPVVDARRSRLICVREDHSVAGREAINTLVSIDLKGAAGFGEILVSGNDFYSNPRFSPDGDRLSWITWNHPNMPWDGTELWVADLAPDGSIVRQRQIAGGTRESIFQPLWSPDGKLYFVSDKSGWWNLYRLNEGEIVEPVLEMEAEFGTPQWVFGLTTFAFASADTIVCNYTRAGISHLASIDLQSCRMTPIDSPFTDIHFLYASDGRVVFRGGAPTEPIAIVSFDLATQEFAVVRRSLNLEIDKEFISPPQTIEFATTNGLTAHGFYYAPRNPDYEAPAGELPPLLVKSHGGPTSAASTALRLGIQFWTSRGIAVLDVNYGGSTGYGREYRERLKDSWGVVDVDDCVQGALHLVNQGVVDGKRLMIMGESAGGYTTLSALTFRDVFQAGASHFGVSDAEALAKETHKFESRYLDNLFGPYPERRDLYYERSPINFTERLSCPVIFFQGLEDRVVPPNQAELMVAALKEKGIPVAYVTFAGEQHGFRQAKNIKRALDAELYFYSRVFGFELGEPVEPVEISCT